MIRRAFIGLAVVLLSTTSVAAPLDGEVHERGRAVVDRAIEYLKSNQNTDNGGWSHNPAGPNLPSSSPRSTYYIPSGGKPRYAYWRKPDGKTH